VDISDKTTDDDDEGSAGYVRLRLSLMRLSLVARCSLKNMSGFFIIGANQSHL
jgi:hypothetical protein